MVGNLDLPQLPPLLVPPLLVKPSLGVVGPQLPRKTGVVGSSCLLELFQSLVGSSYSETVVVTQVGSTLEAVFANVDDGRRASFLGTVEGSLVTLDVTDSDNSILGLIACPNGPPSPPVTTFADLGFRDIHLQSGRMDLISGGSVLSGTFTETWLVTLSETTVVRLGELTITYSLRLTRGV